MNYQSLFQVSVESLVKVIGMMDKHILDTADLQMNVLPVSSNCAIQYVRTLLMNTAIFILRMR